MKKTIAIIIFLLFYLLTILTAANAETKKEPLEVMVKVGVHNDFIRVVFLMPESQVKEASVDKTDNTIKININAFVHFNLLKGKQEGNYVRISSPIKLIDGLIIEPKIDGCILNMEGPGHIKTLKLFNPSRLVVDIYFSGFTEKDKQSKYNIVMVDPGHGGYDRGISSSSFVEKNFVLTFSKAFAERAEKLGKKAILLRNADYAISMRDRIRTINKKRPDVLISFHLSLGDEFVVYTSDGSKGKEELNLYIKESELISKSTISNLKKLGIKVKSDKVGSLIGAYLFLPSILIELPNPEKFVYDKKINQKIIDAILNSLEIENE